MRFSAKDYVICCALIKIEKSLDLIILFLFLTSRVVLFVSFGYLDVCDLNL